MISPMRGLVLSTLVVAGLAGLVFAGLMTMVLWSDPQFAAAPDVSPEALAKSGISFEQPYPSEVRSFVLEDGTTLRGQYLKASGAQPGTTVLLVHGILGAGFLLNETSGGLREAVAIDGDAEVVAIDLRGHGFSDGARGDIDRIGQYETHLGEIVGQLRQTSAGKRVILAGHSMGGGIALRYAQDPSLPPVDGYLLLAPYLGWNSPTTRHTAAPGSEDVLQIHLARILGLKAFNAVGITAFNGLRIQFFNLPPELPHRSYSFRASESMAPEDVGDALQAVRAPLEVIVGSDDEAFLAAEYEPLVTRHSKGQVVTIDGATHNGVTRDPRSMAAVQEWAARLR